MIYLLWALVFLSAYTSIGIATAAVSLAKKSMFTHNDEGVKLTIGFWWIVWLAVIFGGIAKALSDIAYYLGDKLYEVLRKSSRRRS